MITIARCKGSIYFKSQCGKCSGCVDEAKEILGKYRTVALCTMTPDIQEAVTGAAYVLIDNFGHEQYTHFMKFGELKNETPG